ncbi:AMP-dependent synthetase [Brevirhabdus pacifica]|uniref:AMP-dependent synthetase n=1 Tax=Brevirhabdus pacifica TaxID=1267768 RepID=A0A1U7DGE0_9RHOB|nr:AMP-binding protein [Brevirhabdus pacifica]APX89036.1 AMP-dependent synthetase [Brevirhabdus pacifica]OWU80247.1 AMP-dependent synthetase [Loktanella sp. 22II-4b]PJJ86394.1 acyl-CoA synthetase (AMP-forming)/AMP-acid ligase II [Brevirhabdus pacifica]
MQFQFDEATPPEGTVRDWVDYRADTSGEAISHLFPGSDAAPLTWAELREGARAVAARLTGLGVARGESVALMMPNGRPAVLCLMGALYGGFRMTAINLVAGAEAVGYALSHSEARFAFVAEGQEDLFTDAGRAHANTVTAIPVGTAGTIDWPAGTAAKLHPVAPDDHALLMYTSGTTGRPKGVIHTQASLLAGGWTPTVAHRLDADDRALCVLPIYHINGLCVTVMGPLVSGGSVAMCARFSASRFWQDVERTGATWFSVVPTIISHLLHGPHDPSGQARARLRFGRSASSALAPEVQTGFETRFGVPIVETMGLTETAAQILSNPLPPGLRKIGSPGIAYGNEVAILDERLRPIGPGVEGEVAVRGPNVMHTYFKNEEATGQALTPTGWLRTGDLGRIDEDGYVFITGRLKELIIKGGENIAPREIDEALYAHADVVEAAAFARPCQSYGERVEAAVRLREGSTVAPGELIELCRARLGAFKCPDQIHIMDDLPKGPSGKIQRLKLASMTQVAQSA